MSKAFDKKNGMLFSTEHKQKRIGGNISISTEDIFSNDKDGKSVDHEQDDGLRKVSRKLQRDFSNLSSNNEYDYQIRRRSLTDKLSSSMSRVDRRLKSCMIVRSLDESLHATIPRRRRSKSACVGFADVEVREYPRTLGDNPSVSKGPAVTLDWDYNISEPMPIDSYEGQRGNRRVACEMVMPQYVREAVLKEHGHSRKDIAEAVREIKKAKSKRTQTVNNIKYSSIQYAAERTKRTVKNVFTIHKRIEKRKEKQRWKEEDKERVAQFNILENYNVSNTEADFDKDEQRTKEPVQREVHHDKKFEPIVCVED